MFRHKRLCHRFGFLDQNEFSREYAEFMFPPHGIPHPSPAIVCGKAYAHGQKRAYFDCNGLAANTHYRNRIANSA